MQRAFDRALRSLVDDAECFVLMAVSGGVDSMVMASLFASSLVCTPSLCTKLAIAHVNFGLRGADSDSDEALVQQWALQANIPFYVQRFDTMTYARTHTLSVEMAARELRYHWFEELRQQIGADYIAVGHNANDHAETMLLNLTRGTGIRGLCGITERRGTIIRPMLRFERARIVEYAQSREIPYREDATNASIDFSRNRIRHKVLPELAKINPKVVARLCENGEYIQQVSNILEELLEEKSRCWCRQEGETLLMEVAKIALDPHAAFWLFEILRPFGFNSGQMAQITGLLQSPSGRKVLSDTHALFRNRDHLALLPRALPNGAAGGKRQAASGADAKPITMVQEAYTLSLHNASDYTIKRDSSMAALDAQKLQFPLTMRLWQSGDKFIPLGMTGFKKVSDLLIDAKVPLWEKERQMVLCSGNDIVWVVGRRIDERYKVGPATQQIAEVCPKEGKPFPSQIF